MIRIQRLDHVVVRARNLEAMLNFYCRVLGCSIEKRNEPIGLIHLRAGRSQIDLIDVNGELGRMGGAPPGDEAHNMDHFCVRVEPFDEAAIRKHLAQFGVEIGPTQQRFGADGDGPSMYIVDPDGNTVELKGPPISA